MANYIDIISACFPAAEAYVQGAQDPTVYADIQWNTTPIPQATLDASVCATAAPEVLEAANVQSGDATGAIFQLVFNKESKSKNTWLSHEGDNSLSSNTVPAIIPMDCKLVSITFSNLSNSTETDVQIHKADINSTSLSEIFTWQVRNTRNGYKSNMENIVFEAGSKVGVYLKDKGTDVKNVVVVMYLQVVDYTPGEHTESTFARSYNDDDDD